MNIIKIYNNQIHIFKSLKWCIENLEYFETLHDNTIKENQVVAGDMTYWIDFIDRESDIFEIVNYLMGGHITFSYIDTGIWFWLSEDLLTTNIKFKNIDDALRYKLIWG